MTRRAYLAIGLLTLLATAGCSGRHEPITIADNTLIVENQSSREWRNVMVTVNDHFRGGTPRLAAGSRLTAPLSQFQTAFGQRFSLARQTVFKVEVAATDDRGEPVALTWGGSRR